VSLLDVRILLGPRGLLYCHVRSRAPAAGRWRAKAGSETMQSLAPTAGESLPVATTRFCAAAHGAHRSQLTTAPPDATCIQFYEKRHLHATTLHALADPNLYAASLNSTEQLTHRTACEACKQPKRIVRDYPRRDMRSTKDRCRPLTPAHKRERRHYSCAASPIRPSSGVHVGQKLSLQLAPNSGACRSTTPPA